MTYARLKSFLLRFRDGVQGTITVEAVVIVPILFWALQATFEIFEMYRYKSVREKATYTVTDMISRTGRHRSALSGWRQTAVRRVYQRSWGKSAACHRRHLRLVDD